MSFSGSKRCTLYGQLLSVLGSPMVIKSQNYTCCASSKVKLNDGSSLSVKQHSRHPQKKNSVSNSKTKTISKNIHPGSSKAKTSIQARTEYDNMINDWITTNWLSVDPKIQSTPCHFFIHDKLMYDNFDNFQNVYETLTINIPLQENKNKIPFDTAKDLWNKEMHTFNDQSLDTNNRSLIESHMRTVLKSIFLRYLKNDNKAIDNINKELKDSKFQRKLLRHFKSNGKINSDIEDKIKNLQNLNIKNDFSIIKDRDWTFFPFIQYNSLIRMINRSNKVTNSMGILEYDSILGNKMNDYKNLEKIQSSLSGGQQNDKFMIITNDREASLEYFRLLKLINKSECKSKGCVILLNQTSSEIDILAQFAPQKVYTGNELYYVVDKFNDIYDILEVL